MLQSFLYRLVALLLRWYPSSVNPLRFLLKGRWQSISEFMTVIYVTFCSCLYSVTLLAYSGTDETPNRYKLYRFSSGYHEAIVSQEPFRLRRLVTCQQVQLHTNINNILEQRKVQHFMCMKWSLSNCNIVLSEHPIFYSSVNNDPDGRQFKNSSSGTWRLSYENFAVVQMK